MNGLARWQHDVAIVLLNLIALGVIVWLIRDPRAAAVRIEPAPTGTPLPTATAVRLRVYVSGAVATPQVVDLAAGARAVDAVAAAGGFAPKADQVVVNLAAPLADGQQLYVPAVGEAPRLPSTAGAAMTAGTGAGPPGTGVSVGTGATGATGSSGTASGAASGGQGGLVNVNTATAAELDALPGVGPALAARIIAYREAHGPFQKVADLQQVSGIGEKTLARFADMVSVR
jgi:competence protein ComEA